MEKNGIRTGAEEKNAERAVRRTIRILKILKKKTDSKHPITQAKIMVELEKYENGKIGEKTLRNTLRYIRSEINFPTYYEVGEEPVVRIACPKLDRKFEESCNDDVEEKSGSTSMGKLYYEQEFSDAELDRLIEGVYFSQTLDKKTADLLIKKIKILGSEHYENNIQLVSTESLFAELEKVNLHENLQKIQEAIIKQTKIEFFFGGYNKDKKLSRTGERKRCVSPYYIIAYNGKYYLLSNTEGKSNIGLYRIDLMREIEIVRNHKRQVKIKPFSENNDAKEGLKPQEYVQQHLNMFYDKPEKIRIKVKKERYTQVTDSFGSNFEYKREFDREHDIIEITSSPAAVANWAMQYCDYIEVVSPKKVRDMVIAKIEGVAEKYGII